MNADERALKVFKFKVVRFLVTLMICIIIAYNFSFYDVIPTEFESSTERIVWAILIGLFLSWWLFIFGGLLDDFYESSLGKKTNKDTQ